MAGKLNSVEGVRLPRCNGDPVAIRFCGAGGTSSASSCCRRCSSPAKRGGAVCAAPGGPVGARKCGNASPWPPHLASAWPAAATTRAQQAEARGGGESQGVVQRGSDATKGKKPYEAPSSWFGASCHRQGKRVTAMEILESRKMKRKPNYNLEKELAVPREKMRCHDVSKEDISYSVNYNFDLW